LNDLYCGQLKTATDRSTIDYNPYSAGLRTTREDFFLI